MSYTTVTVTGNVVADPIMRTTTTGRVVTHVRVASDERRLNPETQQWETTNTSFYDVSCWQMLGERVAASIRKGDPVYFCGRQQVREFTRDNGHSDHNVDVQADVFGPDLRRVSVTVNRKTRPAAAEETAAATAASTSTPATTEAAVDPWASELSRRADAPAVAEPAA
ncbi:MAG: single-stranded DNA-binding protein [Actinomycetes bacterium]